LSGKYNAESTFNDIRNRWSKRDIQTRAQLVNSVKEIIQAKDNLAQKAISFCLAYDAVSTVIPGNVNIAQLTSNVESINNPISSELVKKLEDFYLNEVKQLNLPW
jgi:aryl-alcohol dehydrogenase-like predicted oxidoreductase